MNARALLFLCAATFICMPIAASAEADVVETFQRAVAEHPGDADLAWGLAVALRDAGAEADAGDRFASDRDEKIRPKAHVQLNRTEPPIRPLQSVEDDKQISLKLLQLGSDVGHDAVFDR